MHTIQVLGFGFLTQANGVLLGQDTRPVSLDMRDEATIFSNVDRGGAMS